MSEPISDEEAFELGYGYFWQALGVLAEPAEQQCESMGNYNVAWELAHDVSAGKHFLSLASCSLTEQQKSAVASLAKDLEDIPPALLSSGITQASSIKAMQHPAWVPFRVRAALLLKQLPLPAHGFQRARP